MAKGGATNPNTTGGGPSWPELLGSGHWSGLLEPLDVSLRRLILRCGDLCQVTYDSFNADQHSKYCGSCRYGPGRLLQKVLFPEAGDFSVAGYLYATSQASLPADFLLFSLSREAWSKESNWIGYVAVSTDAAASAAGHREIYIAWRGTTRSLEWIDVLKPELVNIDTILSPTATGGAGGGGGTASSSPSSSSSGDSSDDPMVMKGWHVIYTSGDPKSPFSKLSVRDQLLAKLKELVQLYRSESLSIICVGHSLGASLAILSAFDIVENGLSRIREDAHFPVCAVVFGCPQIGNKAFNDRLEKQPNLRVLHVKNKIDLIPRYPSGILGYVYTGVDLVVDSRKSPYLKDSKHPGDWHNLQGILHAVAGWNGEDKEFEFKVKRSVALVNKSSEFLKDECLIPGSWWVENNKGMVLTEDGEWRLAPPVDEDIPAAPSEFKVGDLMNTVADGKPAPAKKKTSSGRRFSSCGSCFRGVN